MPFYIRAAQLPDLTAILKIFNQAILTGTANWRSQALTLVEYTAWYQQLQQDQFPLLVAVEAETEKIAGFADYAAFRSLVGYNATVEHSVFIDPQFSRQGLGQRLMQHLIDHAQQAGKHVMVAAIDHENHASIVMHEKLGFIKTGYLPQVGEKFGQWRDLVLMQLIFSEKN